MKKIITSLLILFMVWVVVDYVPTAEGYVYLIKSGFQKRFITLPAPFLKAKDRVEINFDEEGRVNTMMKIEIYVEANQETNRAV